MYNLRTKESDTWSGVKGEVAPVFSMSDYGDNVSLVIN